MSRILKVSQSDYRVRVQNGGTITLDTGVDIGTVVVTGNLVVQGETTTVSTSNVTIEDNIIVLNKGETGEGITLNQDGTRASGIEIDRGAWANAQMLFDETIPHYDPLTLEDVNGTFVLKLADGTLSGVRTNSITTAGVTDLVFDLRAGENVLRIENTDATAYANRLGYDLATTPDTIEDNFIPNKKFVTSYVVSGLVVPGQADIDRIYKAVGGAEQTRAQTYNDSIGFFVALDKRAEVKSSGLYVDFVRTYDNFITATSKNLLLTASNHNVEVDAVLNLKKQAAEVAPPAIDGTGALTKVYTNTTPIATAEANYTPGQTGIYFTNTLNTDEVIAKNRALLFSMIF